MASVTIRSAEPGEERRVTAVDVAAFSARIPEAVLDATLPLFAADRMLVAEDGDDGFVGSAASFPFALTVPGGSVVRAGGVTAVGVLPTHRRRGVLRALMAAQLDDLAGRGEAVALLTASESGIYRRFGYGVATHAAEVEIDPAHTALLAEPAAGGRVRLVDGEAAVARLGAAHDAVAAVRPGTIGRDAAWWTAVLAEPESFVGGGSPFALVHEDDHGAPDGYALYRATSRWDDDGLPAGTLHVGELVATTPEVEAELLARVCRVDLMDRIRVWRPVDDWWRHRLVEPRQLRTRRIIDHLWARILDVPAALTARRYAWSGALVLDVVDPFRPAMSSRVRLEVGADGAARCAGTDEAPDLVLDVADLGSIWLGGVPVGRLVAAGLVREMRPGAATAAEACFAWSPTPWCLSRF